MVYENKQAKDIIGCDIPLGKLCCFKPLNKNVIHFGHMTGKVIDDFANMSFMYVLTTEDDDYYFSRDVIIKPDDVHTALDAERYFD